MRLLSIFVRMTTSFTIFFIFWSILFFGYNLFFWSATGLALSGSVLSYGLQSWYTQRKFLKKHRLTRKEYAFISQNLQEAKHKLKRLQKAYLNIRSVDSFRQLRTTHRLAKKIYTLVKNEPRRFYSAERFFYYHLDSLVELAEKHTFLRAHAIQNREMKQSLRETQDTINALVLSVEEDLRHVLDKDIHQLDYELDVAKHTLKAWAPPLKERGLKK